MDRSADPCTDFDRYVCGRFNDDAIIPDKKHMVDLTTTGIFLQILTIFNDSKNRLDEHQSEILYTLTVMPEVVYQKARNLMQKKESSNFSTDQNIYNLYDSCINDRGRERTGLKPAKHFLCKFGGWPVLEDTNCNQNYR